MSTRDKVLELVSEYGSAMFDCGEFQYENHDSVEDDEYGRLLERLKSARTALEAALEPLFREGGRE